MSNKIIITGVANAPMDMRKDGSMTVTVDLMIPGRLSPSEATDIVHMSFLLLEVEVRDEFRKII